MVEGASNWASRVLVLCSFEMDTGELTRCDSRPQTTFAWQRNLPSFTRKPLFFFSFKAWGALTCLDPDLVTHRFVKNSSLIHTLDEAKEFVWLGVQAESEGMIALTGESGQTGKVFSNVTASR